MLGRHRLKFLKKSMPTLKKPKEIEFMGVAGRKLAHILGVLKKEVRIGRATYELEIIS